METNNEKLGKDKIIEIDLSDAKPILNQSINKKKGILIFILLLIVFFILTISLAVTFFLKEKETNYISPVKINGNPSSQAKNSKAITPSITSPKKQINREISGFLPSWIIAKKTKINLEGLNQLIYFGLAVNDKGEIVKRNNAGDEVLEWTYFKSDYFNELKKQASAKKIKIIIALKNFDNKSIDNLISSELATKTLVNNLITLIKEDQIDGINIDFEYFSDIDFPTFKYLNSFLEKLSEDLKKEKQNFVISFDVNAVNVITDRAYDMTKIGEIVDQVILMAYDYHRADSLQAGPVAPISSSENEHNIIQSIDSLKGRVPKEKLILGIPFYGYEWQTISKSYESSTIPTTGALATYERVRELIENRDDVEVFWDEKAMSPWLVYNQSGAIKQIYYEDEKSIGKKIEFVKEKSLGGIAIWALGYEGENKDLWQAISNINVN